ncbi:proteasome subunit beta type-2-A-like, partial [Brassica napus]|uniref:proteasome subunit beta type-2-A-like n=1 Tax=Brassica napus TaxID=3708 RepID=UPI002078A3F0
KTRKIGSVRRAPCCARHDVFDQNPYSSLSLCSALIDGEKSKICPCFCFGFAVFDQNPYSVNILMAGYDNESGASLYYIDYIATLHKVDKGAFGYGSYFSLSTMDRHYRSDMSVEEAIELVDKCILEIRSRLVVAPPNFVIKIVDKDGARDYAWRQSVQDVTTAAV